jgi:hypothetical protein
MEQRPNGNGINRIWLTTFVSALASIGVFVKSGNALDIYNFPKSANPTEVSEYFDKATMEESNESFAIIARDKKGNFYSEALEGQATLILDTEILKVLKKLEQRLKFSLNGEEIWLVHNHPVEVIKRVLIAGGVDRKIFIKPDRLLNGPSPYDCQQFLEKVKKGSKPKLYGNFLNTKVTNVVVEPGGTWICSSDYSKKITEADEDAFNIERKKLAIATQTKENYSEDIKQFQVKAIELMGVEMKFIPKNKIVETKELPVNSDPFSAAIFLREMSGTRGHAYESVIFSIAQGNKWISMMEKSDNVTVSFNAVKKLTKRMDEIVDKNNKNDLWATHNHPAEMMARFIMSIGLNAKDIVDKEKLLSGPSEADCRSIESSDSDIFDGKNRINLIVEPGGLWVCKVLDYVKLTKVIRDKDTAQKYLELRRNLFIKSQILKDEDLEKLTSDFAKQSEEITGIKSIFVPFGEDRTRFNEAAKKIK